MSFLVPVVGQEEREKEYESELGIKKNSEEKVETAGHPPPPIYHSVVCVISGNHLSSFTPHSLKHHVPTVVNTSIFTL